VIVTVEEVVEEFEPRPFQIVMPSVAIDAVAVEPEGARPSYAAAGEERGGDVRYGLATMCIGVGQVSRWSSRR
jgi:hypothetical protein